MLQLECTHGTFEVEIRKNFLTLRVVKYLYSLFWAGMVLEVLLL